MTLALAGTLTPYATLFILEKKYYSVQEKIFFEGITTPKVCIKIELSRREWVSVLLLVIFDDFGMIWIPNDQLDCFQQILYISTT